MSRSRPISTASASSSRRCFHVETLRQENKIVAFEVKWKRREEKGIKEKKKEKRKKKEKSVNARLQVLFSICVKRTLSPIFRRHSNNSSEHGGREELENAEEAEETFREIRIFDSLLTNHHLPLPPVCLIVRRASPRNCPVSNNFHDSFSLSRRTNNATFCSLKTACGVSFEQFKVFK